MVSAWYMDDKTGDQRQTHELNPSISVPINKLKDYGVDYWYFDPDYFRSDDLYERLIHERHFTYEDMVEISPETTVDYMELINTFYEEHIHIDEEIRFVLSGSGYFDVRDFQDKWIRIEVTKGDMICLPPGLFHRFTPDGRNYIKALRLYSGIPNWIAFPRSQMKGSLHPAIIEYKKRFLSKFQARDSKSVPSPIPMT